MSRTANIAVIVALLVFGVLCVGVCQSFAGMLVTGS